MKRLAIYVTFFVFLGESELYSQSGQWVWMKGDSTFNSDGIYDMGYLGVFSSSYEPQAVWQPCNWRDKIGHFWMFGGLAYQDSDPVHWNSLWQFDPYITEWALMRSSASGNSAGSYGIKGVSSPDNIPPARTGAASWIDTAGNLWMFGGGSYYNFVWYDYNDLWKYDVQTNEWTWVKGSDQLDQLGTYGTKGVAHPANTPGSRNLACTWTDKFNNLWLFGGEGYLENGHFNDLWKYNISNNKWTWIDGHNGFIYGIDFLTNYSYGILGVSDSTNMPPARGNPSCWQDTAGNFYLFGGFFPTTWGTDYFFDDLWKFNTQLNEWTWIGGDSVPNKLGLSGAFCEDSDIYSPEGRSEAANWVDNNQTFWMLGGTVIYDEQNSVPSISTIETWNYKPKTNEWMKVYGDSLGTDGYYGQKGIISPYNAPPSRRGCVGWVDSMNNFWIFGGDWNYNDMRNDLWKFTLDTSCGGLGVPTAISSIPISELSIYPNPSNGELKIILPDNIITTKYLSIIDQYGRKVYNEKNYASNKDLSLDFLSSGWYLVIVNVGDKQYSAKFLKQ